MKSGKARKRQPPARFQWKLCVQVILFITLMTFTIVSVDKMKQAREFPIHDVKVFGVQHVDRDQLQQKVLPYVSKGFFAVEIEAIKERILQEPWISEATVRRVWPDQVIITIVERDPVARWNENSVLSQNGEIFSPSAASVPDGLPQFIGPDGEQIHMLQYYAKISRVITPLHFKIARLELTAYDSWNMTFDSGMRVNLGLKDILTRLNHFVKVYPKIVGERAADVDYIDLRYTNGLAVRWKTVS